MLALFPYHQGIMAGSEWKGMSLYYDWHVEDLCAKSLAQHASSFDSINVIHMKIGLHKRSHGINLPEHMRQFNPFWEFPHGTLYFCPKIILLTMENSHHSYWGRFEEGLSSSSWGSSSWITGCHGFVGAPPAPQEASFFPHPEQTFFWILLEVVGNSFMAQKKISSL